MQNDYTTVFVIGVVVVADRQPYLSSLNLCRFPGVDGTPKLKFVDDDVSCNKSKENRGSIEEKQFQGSNHLLEPVHVRHI